MSEFHSLYFAIKLFCHHPIIISLLWEGLLFFQFSWRTISWHSNNRPAGNKLNKRISMIIIIMRSRFFFFVALLAAACSTHNLSMHVIDAFHYLSGNYPQLPVIIIPIKNGEVPRLEILMHRSYWKILSPRAHIHAWLPKNEEKCV